ncbi:MAG: TonB-dependent receptor [Parasphingorhabdus sp.]|nr:TonB-dependent receptor [Parasphingorhabdus sp.]
MTPNDSIKWRTRLSYEIQDDGTPALFLQGASENNCNPGFRSANYRTSSFAFPFWPVARTSTNTNQYFCGVIKPGTVALNNVPTPVLFRSSPFAPFGTRTLDGTPIDGYYKKRWFLTSGLDADLGDSGWSTSAIVAYRNEVDRTGTDSDHSDAFVFFNLNPVIGGTAPNLLTDLPAFTNTHRSKVEDISAELKLSTPKDKPIRGLFGAYFYDYSLEDRIVDFATIPDGVPFGGPGSYRERIHNASVFGSIAVDITDGLTLTAEGRYLTEKKTRQEFVAPGSQLYSGPDTKDFIPRVTLDWKPDDTTLVYAIYSEGNKPGGTNASAGASIGRPQYLPETLRGGEFGIKKTMFNNRVQANIAIYYNKLQNVQLTTALPVGGGALTSVATNQGDATSKGFEVELTVKPAKPLTLNLGVAYTDSRFTSGCDDFEYTLNTGGRLISNAANPTAAEAPLCSIAGNRLPLGSPWQANGAVDFRTPITSAMEVFANVNGSYESSKFVQVHNLAETGDTFLLNARLGVGGEQWELALFGRNLTDEDSIPLATRWFDLRYGIGVSPTQPANTAALAYDRSFPRAFFGALRKGRTFGAEAKFKF